MKRLNNEFELSNLEVVLSSPARGAPIKYDGIYDFRI
jgi:hypothetical protein